MWSLPDEVKTTMIEWVERSILNRNVSSPQFSFMDGITHITITLNKEELSNE